MSMTSPDENITNGGTSSDVPPTAGTEAPVTVLPSSSNGGPITEEIKNSNNANPVPVEPLVVQADTATNAARSSSSIRQFFPGGDTSDWMKREKLDMDALEKALAAQAPI